MINQYVDFYTKEENALNDILSFEYEKSVNDLNYLCNQYSKNNTNN